VYLHLRTDNILSRDGGQQAVAAFGKTRRRRELPLKSGLKKVERQLCAADSGHLRGVQNLGLWTRSRLAAMQPVVFAQNALPPA
jgi:hypothetical protein